MKDKTGNIIIHKSFPQENILEGAFDLSDEEKVSLISEKFREILEIIGLDLKDDSLIDTPKRIAKMYVNEIFSGINPVNKPIITLFDNKFKYHEPLIEKNIPFSSFCEHHFVPISGSVNIAYIPENRIVGLSKLHRIVNYYSKRPQIQERLTLQIRDALSSALKIENVGVVIKASHMCISCRGIEHRNSYTITSALCKSIEENNSLKTELFSF